MSNIPPPVEQPGHHEGSVAEAENSIELKEIAGLSQGQIVRRRFFRHKGALISMFALAFIILLSFTSVGVAFGDWKSGGWWQYTWNVAVEIENNGRPTLSLFPFAIGNHPFGQDEVGRDIFAVVMRGTQQSLMIMVIVGVIATIIGTVIGAVSGYYRGWRDSVLMRFTDVIITIPVIVIAAVLGRRFGDFGAPVLAVILGLLLWTGLARLVRGEFLSLREREFVDAARVAGANDNRIIFRHILPNAIGVIIVNSTLLMASAILIETGISFLGYGVQAPDTSLGKIISENQVAFATRPWLFWWPGVFIIAIALCINFIGDGLRDAFDPRQKRMPSDRALARADRDKTPVGPAPLAEAEARVPRASGSTGMGTGL
ncbi:ABC transporter permease [Antiquaquibacter soli]|uniref:ABC transporter permease n=1 Tax=Antiquaquibacter soli TaxID=3064523 RepID=A0ABT9BLI4_9MICO|nr:ABC transporter permease [Protaetiibacter sp. WY-16]MDO7881303.1 ABC transporter permease [Protaetiibacter sp. WY-16]